MSTHRFRFEPYDTWFFREPRPFESVGGTELSSVFPPSARTLGGAIRTLIGDAVNVDWHAFAKGNGRDHGGDFDLRELIGDGDSPGRLVVCGPYLEVDGERLFPLPRHVLVAGTEAEPQFALLRPGAPISCDLGAHVRLPEVVGQIDGGKTLDNAWLKGEDFERVLRGEAPQEDFERVLRGETPRKVIRAAAPKPPTQARANDASQWLFAEESRLGIGRDNRRHTAQEQLLYQTRHLRPHPGLAVTVAVKGLPESPALPTRTTVRFGGEGRLASVAIEALDAPDRSATASDPPAGAEGLVLVLLTPADCGAKALPPDFTPETLSIDGKRTTVWTGTLNGVELELFCGATGRPSVEGGWNLAKREPRPLRPLVPAGSCWFVKPRTGTLAEAARKLHGFHVGAQAELGRGELAVGYWPAAAPTKSSA